MKLFAAAMALVAGLMTLTAASPTPGDVAGKPSSNPDHFKQYYLKTKLIKGSGSSQFNGLYVTTYHTGAGLSDATLVKHTKNALPAFLNGTYQLFKFEEGHQPYFPWGLSLALETFYTGWQPTEINVGYGDKGFFLNGTGLQHKRRDGFGGWRVCNWWHNGPQLFYKYYYYDFAPPSNCADVHLIPEYI